MSFFVDIVSEDSFYENLTLGVMRLLENCPCVKNVRLERKPPCDRANISNWEQRHCCSLSEDMRNFYLSTDGFLITWKLELAGEEFPIGRMEIRELKDLKRFHPPKDHQPQQQVASASSSLENLESTPTTDETDYDPRLIKPNFSNPRTKLFEMADCDDAKVILAYHVLPTDQDEPSIWLYHPEDEENRPDDSSTASTSSKTPSSKIASNCQWHRLSDNFTRYFRMMLVHLGLPQWQVCAAGLKLPIHLEQVYNLVAPHLLPPTTTKPLKNQASTVSKNLWVDGPTNLIDPAIFRTREAGKSKTAARTVTTSKEKSKAATNATKN